MKNPLILLFLTGLFTACQSITTPTINIDITNVPIVSTEEISSKYIGLIYPPIPDSLVFQEGTSIYPSNNIFKWSVAKVLDDNYSMLWLSKVVSYNANGIPNHQVSDVVILPPEEEKTVVAVSTCLLSGVVNSEIVALAKWDEEFRTTRYIINKNILMVWIANQTTGKFEEISSKNVECYFE